MENKQFPTLNAFGIDPETIEKTGTVCKEILAEAGFSEQDIDVLSKDAFDELIEKIKNKDSDKYDVASFNLTEFITTSMYEQTAEFIREQGLTAKVGKDGLVINGKPCKSAEDFEKIMQSADKSLVNSRASQEAGGLTEGQSVKSKTDKEKQAERG